MDYVESYYFAIGWPEIALGVGLLALLLFGVWKLAKIGVGRLLGLSAAPVVRSTALSTGRSS